MTEDDLSSKKQRVDDDGMDTQMENDRPLTAHSILALFPQAIREEGVAKKEDITALETGVDQKLFAAQSEWEGRMGELTSNVDKTIGAASEQVTRLESRFDQVGERSGAGCQPVAAVRRHGLAVCVRATVNGPRLAVCVRATVRMSDKSEYLQARGHAS